VSIATGVVETYLDNASTAYPKPDCVWESARSFLTDIGVSPGRSGHRRARLADEMVEETRELLASLFNIGQATHIAFTTNATAALNIGIKGFLGAGDRVVTTATEHNSVLRPLEQLRRNGLIDYRVVAPDRHGVFDLDEFESAVADGARLVIVNQASNVTGALAPVPAIAAIARRHGTSVLLDASQTAGVADIDVEGWGIDMLAFTGHKCLLGPSGTGGLYVRVPSTVRTLTEGGTGMSSHSLRHPAVMPAKFEAGTLNYMGIAGLNAALKYKADKGCDWQAGAQALVERMVGETGAVPGLSVYAPAAAIHRIPIVSFNLRGLFASELAAVLDNHFGIMTRAGLHCAPLIHRVLGTAPAGTVRASLGPFTTAADVDRLIDALRDIGSDIDRFMK
jgi:cysteine desulfurase family protein